MHINRYGGYDDLSLQEIAPMCPGHQVIECVYVYVHMCMFGCISVCECVCMLWYVFITDTRHEECKKWCVCIHVRISTHVRMYVFIGVCICILGVK